MATKRKTTGSEPSTSKRLKTSTHHNHGALPKKTNPINPLKSRIRSLTRLLDDSRPGKTSSSNLGADIRLAHERELKSLQYELAAAQRAEKRRQAIGKWHMVRFFDRKKAERRLRQTVKRVRSEGFEVLDAEEAGEVGLGAGSSTELERVRDEVHAARVDLKYTVFCPLERPYASLWPSKGRDGEEGDAGGVGGARDAAGGARGDRDMWLLVEKCMAEGRLEQLRNGEAPELLDKGKKGARLERGVGLDKAGVGSKSSVKQKGRSGQGKRSEVQAPAVDDKQEEDDESDGGFFE